MFLKNKMRYYGSVLNNFQKGKVVGKKSPEMVPPKNPS